MNTNLTLKITLTILVLLSLTLGMISLLNYFKFDTTLADIVRSRSEVTSLDLKNTIENSLKAGWSLASNGNLAQLINRTKQQNEQILKIEIFDQNGTILFSTDLDRVDQMVGREWLNCPAKDEKSYKETQQKNSESFDICENLQNSFDKYVGGILLQSSKVYHRSKVDAMFFSLGSNLILVLICSSVLTTILVFIVFKNTSNSFKKMNQSLLPLLKQTEPMPVLQNPSNDLEQKCQHFQQQAHQAFEMLEQAQHTVVATQKTDSQE